MLGYYCNILLVSGNVVADVDTRKHICYSTVHFSTERERERVSE